MKGQNLQCGLTLGSSGLLSFKNSYCEQNNNKKSSLTSRVPAAQRPHFSDKQTSVYPLPVPASRTQDTTFNWRVVVPIVVVTPHKQFLRQKLFKLSCFKWKINKYMNEIFMLWTAEGNQYP